MGRPLPGPEGVLHSWRCTAAWTYGQERLHKGPPPSLPPPSRPPPRPAAIHHRHLVRPLPPLPLPCPIPRAPSPLSPCASPSPPPPLSSPPPPLTLPSFPTSPFLPACPCMTHRQLVHLLLRQLHPQHLGNKVLLPLARLACAAAQHSSHAAATPTSGDSRQSNHARTQVKVRFPCRLRACTAAQQQRPAPLPTTNASLHDPAPRHF